MNMYKVKCLNFTCKPIFLDVDITQLSFSPCQNFMFFVHLGSVPSVFLITFCKSSVLHLIGNFDFIYYFIKITFYKRGCPNAISFNSRNFFKYFYVTIIIQYTRWVWHNWPNETEVIQQPILAVVSAFGDYFFPSLVSMNFDFSNVLHSKT